MAGLGPGQIGQADGQDHRQKDANNKVWPTVGKFCNGEYNPEKEQQTCEILQGDSEGDDASSGGASSSGG